MDGATAERARQGRKFGPAATDYEQGRPDWPAGALEVAAAALALGPASTVVDLGAGTGKLTRALAARFGKVIAVEPLAEMRRVLIAHALPGVEVRAGVAEALPLAALEADAVFVAEAFHWFDAPAALAEAARVLAPGGGIALLWNIVDGPSEPPVPLAAKELYRAALARGGEPGGTWLARGEWRDAFAGSPFGQLHHAQVSHEAVRDREGEIAMILSVSSVAGLPPAEREALRADLRELLADTHYRQPLRTDLYWARLADAGWCDRCGEPLAEGDHAACAARQPLEPPRYCRQCRRRMKVQVLPAGWSARCVEHGELRAG